MAERFGLHRHLNKFSEGSPRLLSMGFLLWLVRCSNLSTLREEPAAGDEPLTTLIVPAQRWLCIASLTGSGEANCRFLVG